MHGGASRLAYGLLHDARRLGVAPALNEALRFRGRVPGFGHSVYRHADPRYLVLAAMVRDLGEAGVAVTGDRHDAGDVDPAAASGVAGVLEALVALAAGRGIAAPNVDLGLAALALATGMPEDAGRTLFTVARVAGWVAHYLEELEERPLRYRARAVYAGRP